MKDEPKIKISNYFIECVLIFVAHIAKVLDVFLLPNYKLRPMRSYLTIFVKKLNKYPLFFDTNYGVPASRIALRFLFYDLVKIVKSLGIEINREKQTFNGFENLSFVIKLVFQRFFN